MREHERKQHSVEKAPWTWDIAGTIHLLRAVAASHAHARFGSGLRLTLPEASSPIPTYLDLYPEHLVARYHSNLVRLEATSVGLIEPEGDHVRLASGGDARLLVCLLYPDGDLTMAMLGSAAEERIRRLRV